MPRMAVASSPAGIRGRATCWAPSREHSSFWLAFLGVRKRRYSSTVGTVEGWTSAHVYLGLAVLVVATLHSAAQVGWNVHTLSYVLLWLVVLSGAVGIQSYVMLPRLLARNREGGGGRRCLPNWLSSIARRAH